jgi:hypothetical protein
MKKTPLINVFNAGELGYDMDARSDVKKYYEGCRVLEGMIPIVEGPAQRMPGTYYMASVKGTITTFFFITLHALIELEDFLKVNAYVPSPLRTTFTSICTDGVYLYHSAGGTPKGYIEKFDLATRSYVGEIQGNSNTSSHLDSCAIDTVNGYAYFCNYGSASISTIYKVRLSDFSVVATLTLYTGYAMSIVLDIANDFGYIANSTVSPNKITKIRLSTLTEISTLSMGVSGASCGYSALIDTNYAYFPILSSPGKIVRLKLLDFSIDSVLSLGSGENQINIMVKDSTYIYCGTRQSPAKIVRVLISTFERADAITLSSPENLARGATIMGTNAYFGTFSTIARIVKVDLPTFTRVEVVNLTGYTSTPSGAVSPFPYS